MNQLTIGTWICTMVPHRNARLLAGQRSADQAALTGQSGAQALESMGSLGSIVDPNAKAIFEFRKLSFVYATDLVDVVDRLSQYIQ